MRPVEQIHSLLKDTIIDEGEDGLRGVYATASRQFRYQFSWGKGWEHASISVIQKNRTPTWKEMCMFKEIFWGDEETVIQYHPAKSTYVNIHEGCLHLWRPISEELPTPPEVFV